MTDADDSDRMRPEGLTGILEALTTVVATAPPG